MKTVLISIATSLSTCLVFHWPWLILIVIWFLIGYINILIEKKFGNEDLLLLIFVMGPIGTFVMFASYFDQIKHWVKNIKRELPK